MSSSLSADTKDAIARNTPPEEHCRRALAAGLAHYGAPDGVFRTQRPAIARLFWSLLAQVAPGEPHGTIGKEPGVRLGRVPVYTIAVPGALLGVPPKPTRRCDRRAEMAAAFLACGSLAQPLHGYHLEFVPPPGAAQRLAAVLATTGFAPKRTRRKSRTVLYYKDADAVVELLSSMGGYSAVLRLEDVRAYKETKNRIQRLVNTDAANVDRAASAGAKQRHAIALLADTLGLRSLSPALREIAELRMAHPEETLGELGRRCKPPISKSSVNGRIAALLRLAAGVRASGKR